MKRIKAVYGGKTIKLYLEKMKLPNGRIVTLEIIYHPGAVVIVPRINQRSVVMIRQYRAAIDSYIWEFPAGTLSKGESAVACARRELMEEVGYAARSFKNIGAIYPAPGYTTERISVFIAESLTKVTQCLEQDEIITSHIVSLKELKRLLRAGKISDAKTICALTLANII